MIIDEILYLEREYRDVNRGAPAILLMSPSSYALLREELNIDPIEEFTLYHGMEIEVDEYHEDIELISHTYGWFEED